jgi:hypothetical protein
MEQDDITEEEFELKFTNGALKNLKMLAEKLGLDPDNNENLGETVNRCIKLLSVIKSINTKKIILESEDEKRYILPKDFF